jgi:hypothetical protein
VRRAVTRCKPGKCAPYHLSAGLRAAKAQLPAPDFPDLREDYQALVESGDSSIPRFAMVNTETDRIVNSLNTLKCQILPLIDSYNSPQCVHDATA